jgi:hypothetical protein
MILKFNKPEIDKILFWILSNPKYKPVLEIMKTTISLNGSIIFKKNLKIGSVMMKIYITALSNGDIELDIKDASISGFGAFGVIRKKAGELIISFVSQYAPQCTIWKNEKGNIQLHMPSVVFKEFTITRDSIFIEAKFNVD